MAFDPATGILISALRTALGTSVVVEDVTYTFQWVVEGPIEDWLADTVNYPMLVFDIPIADATKAGEPVFMVRMDQGFSVYIVIPRGAMHENPNVPPRRWELIRLIGEAMLRRLMGTGPQLGTTVLKRELQQFGIDRATPALVGNPGVLVYVMKFGAQYHDKDE